MRPNHIQIVGADHDFKFSKEDIWKVTLNDGYQASAQFCKDGKACEGSVAGTWSTIYDQAMRVELENGVRFLTNFRYNVKDNISSNPLKDGESKFTGLSTGDYGSFDSDCSKTMVGFVQKVHGSGSLTDHPIQCFYGKQVQHFNLETSEHTETEDGVKMDKIVSKKQGGQTLVEETSSQNTEESAAEDAPANSGPPADETNVLLRTSHKRMNAHHMHVPSDSNDLLIQTINELDLGWKADTCKYQTHHANYGSHCQKDTVMLA